jgi:DNA mismatch repair protein MutL
MEATTIINNKINILSPSLSNKIAAGEVVERPASVIKELIENAIDADARKISIVIKQSGKQLIQVIDDGQGISEIDLELAFKRHATSKISSDQDLEKIETLGFRGEALPSIASVSQIEVCSREKNERLGRLLRIDAGNIIQAKKVACPAGTNISVKNLFYNTPARRNFLRSNNTELQKILSTLKRFFLAYPDIDYEVISDSSQLFRLENGDIAQRIKDVFGEELFQALIPINETLGGIELSGFVSRPDKTRRSRGNQFIFINGRPILDKALSNAVFQGYSNMISPGEYPTYCLFLEMDAKLVDVNVHPTKMEVRFSNERSLYYFFMSSLRKVFTDAKVIPKLGTASSDSFLARFNQPVEHKDIAQEIKNRRKYLSRGTSNQLSLAYFKPEAEEKSDRSEPEQLAQDVDVQFWQIHDRYILSEIKSGMVIIDQHIAHERILYERILKILQDNAKSTGQQLLFPQTLTLSVDDFIKFKEIIHLLNKIGFGVRVFSGTSIVIDAIPVDVKVGREAQVVLDIIDYYKANQDKQFNPLERMAAAFSCKNAIKSGEVLTQAEMHAIVDQLFACESPYFCPHGRPVVVTMDLEELDRKFKRL